MGFFTFLRSKVPVYVNSIAVKVRPNIFEAWDEHFNVVPDTPHRLTRYGQRIQIQPFLSNLLTQRQQFGPDLLMLSTLITAQKTRHTPAAPLLSLLIT